MSINQQIKGLPALGYPGLLLGIAVALSTTLLALGQLGTAAAIHERQKEDLNASLVQVIPALEVDRLLLQPPLQLTLKNHALRTVYRATHQQQIGAVAFTVTAPDGYGGPIQMLLGLSASGQITGVRVLSHRETPGLGDKIEVAKSPWIRGFDGLDPASLTDTDWAVKKDGGQFDQFTGATITPRAVVRAIHQGVQFYRKQRQTLLESPPPVSPTDRSIHSGDS